MEGKCPVCDQTAIHRCSKCHLAYYCSKDHQKDHWKIHKHHCMPVIVKEDKLLGRHLIASRNLKEGQIVFKEKPLVVGPSQITVPVCMGCCKVLTETTSKPCDRCGWPVCGDFCQQSPHHRPECDLTVARGNKVHIHTFGVPHPNYQSITVLRCLYQKKANPIIWEKLMALESHDEHRRGTDKWTTDEIQIAQFISRFFKLGTEFTEQEIMKVCGIVQVNGHEVPLTEPPFVAVYDVTSMVEHNCRANCNKSFSSRGEVLVVAATEIPAGENITICYTDPLWGTANRRHHLLETKFFECSCTRCRDVTDLGTMLSAVRCQTDNCNGYVLPKTFLTSAETEKQKREAEAVIETQSGNVYINDSNNNGETNSTKEKQIKSDKKGKNAMNGKEMENLQEDSKKKDDVFISNGNQPTSLVEGGNSKPNGNAGSSDGFANGNDAGKEVKERERVYWFCDKCGETVNEVHVYKLMDHIGKDLNAMEKGNCDSCLRFLEHYGKYLHPNHYYMVDVTLVLAQLIGQEKGSCLQTVKDERLTLKVKTCTQMSEFLEKLVPAELRARGGVIFELHAAVAETGRREAARAGAGPPVMIKYLLESKEMLEKSIKYLEHEPEDLPEGKICKQAKVNLGDMEAMLQNLFALDSPM